MDDHILCSTYYDIIVATPNAKAKQKATKSSTTPSIEVNHIKSDLIQSQLVFQVLI
jgi:hypothetical protein